MLKVIIVLILIGYVFYRVTSFIFSGMFKGFTGNNDPFRNQTYSRNSRRAPNSNVNIDRPSSSSGSDRDSDYQGGEYVDYEEVK